MEAIRNSYKILEGKPEGKRPLERTRHRWEDDNRIILEKQGGKLWTGFIWLRIRTSGRYL
jgi:hypothetical protein